MAQDDLFALSENLDIRFEMIGGMVPVILVDNLYRYPDAIREMALGLSFAPPPYPYPGQLAVAEQSASLAALSRWALELVKTSYLPRVPLVPRDGPRIIQFRALYTDFAIIDVHPDELSLQQRIPHTDPVPLFGLVYLNREARGGTLFFDQLADIDEIGGAGGYFTASDHQFELRGRIEAAFNRLAIYPGFVPHSGDIRGDWIHSDERFTSPRLTQRLVFLA